MRIGCEKIRLKPPMSRELDITSQYCSVQQQIAFQPPGMTALSYKDDLSVYPQKW